MTKVRLDNANTSVTKYYAELSVKQLEHNLLNAPINYPEPQTDFANAPSRKFYDFKSWKEEYEIVGHIDNTTMFTNSSYNSVSSTTNVYTVKSQIIDIAQSGGVVNLKIVLNAGSPSTITGAITDLKFIEASEDQDDLAPADIMQIRFKFLVGTNS